MVLDQVDISRKMLSLKHINKMDLYFKYSETRINRAILKHAEGLVDKAIFRNIDRIIFFLMTRKTDVIPLHCGTCSCYATANLFFQCDSADSSADALEKKMDVT